MLSTPVLLDPLVVCELDCELVCEGEVVPKAVVTVCELPWLALDAWDGDWTAAMLPRAPMMITKATATAATPYLAVSFAAILLEIIHKHLVD